VHSHPSVNTPPFLLRGTPLPLGAYQETTRASTVRTTNHLPVLQCRVPSILWCCVPSTGIHGVRLVSDAYGGGSISPAPLTNREAT